ncbi:hypothetical protein GCM10017559_48430 [Streptosporangium longisporum]|uniref:DUF4236 domain-containing protein n=1 Tax=Streptosporangium longisporum TaxID=46187 RepID=A0ABN3Y8I5_9ACTN
MIYRFFGVKKQKSLRRGLGSPRLSVRLRPTGPVRHTRSDTPGPTHPVRSGPGPTGTGLDRERAGPSRGSGGSGAFLPGQDHLPDDEQDRGDDRDAEQRAQHAQQRAA